MESDEKFYLAALARCPGLGSRWLQKLCQSFAAPRQVWNASAEELVFRGQLPGRLAERLALFSRSDHERPDRLHEECLTAQIRLCSFDDAAYPSILKEIFDPPMVLYYRGTLQPEADRAAVVGSRKFTPYGEGIALEFGERLAAAGLTVVSGAARGIDTCAHKGALKSGRTVAVLGCGVDVAYPSENRRLLTQIAASEGAVLSEYGPGTQPLPAFFPARNRIISGLSQGTLVVEAARRSGSLITAEMALAEGRDVFAVPGSIYSGTSQGCNHLIQQGAKLVQAPADILEEYGLEVPAQKKERPRMTSEERQVWQVLSFEHPLSIDEIIISLPDGELSNLAFILLQMEMKGLVIENELHAYRRAERE